MPQSYNFSSNHSFYERSGDHDTLIVIFNYFNQPISARSHYKFLNGIDCNKLFLHSGANDWFQCGIPGIASSFEELIGFSKSINNCFSERKILYIGHSMGAFAALACGIASGADRILVSVPEIELCLPGSMSEKCIDKYKLSYQSIASYLNNNNVQIDCIIGYEDVYDRTVAKQLSIYENVSVHMLKCGHETFPYLRDEGILANLFHEFAKHGDLKTILSPYYLDDKTMI